MNSTSCIQFKITNKVLPPALRPSSIRDAYRHQHGHQHHDSKRQGDVRDSIFPALDSLLVEELVPQETEMGFKMVREEPPSTWQDLQER